MFRKREDINGLSVVGGNTSFIYHCLQNNIDVVIELVKNGCNVTLISNNWNGTGLTLACEKGHTALVEKLLQLNEIKNILDDRTFGLCLKNACILGHCDLFDLLISNGADPNITDENGISLLMIACCYNQVDIVDRLLSLPIDINYVNEINNTRFFQRRAIHCCRSPDVFHRLLIYGADIHSTDDLLIHYIIYGHNDEIVFALINCGYNINQYPNDRTPLMWAVLYSRINIVRKLVEFKVDVTIKDVSGRTALNMAMSKNNQDIINLFVDQ